MNNLRQNVEEFCIANYISKREFASIAGVTEPTLYALNHGCVPSQATIEKMASCTGVNPEKFLSKGIFREDAIKSLELRKNAATNIDMYCVVNGITRSELSEMTGVSAVTIIKIINGYEAKSSILRMIAEGIGLTIEEFLSNNFDEICWPKGERMLYEEVLITCIKTKVSKEEFAKMAGISYRTLAKIFQGDSVSKFTETKIRQILHHLELS